MFVLQHSTLISPSPPSAAAVVKNPWSYAYIPPIRLAKETGLWVRI